MNDQQIKMQLLKNLMQGFNRMNPEVVKYQKVRAIHQEIITSMSKYISTRRIGPQDVLEKAKTRDFKLDLSTRQGSQIYGDIIVYPHYSEIPSVTEVYLSKNKFRKEEKVKMLEAMLNSYISIFEIVERDDFDSIVVLRDVFTSKTIKIRDSQMGEFNTSRDLCFLLRIISYDDISFQTGLVIPLKKNKTTKKWINKHKKLYFDKQDVVLLVETYLFYLKEGYDKIPVMLG